MTMVVGPNFFLQHLGTADQQAGIGLEQLRVRLIALLLRTCEMANAFDRGQMAKAFDASFSGHRH
jgi:hypothetical protein